MTRRGPRTDAGKAAVRHNAVRHGILSSAPILPYFEREEDWQAHRDSIIRSLGPIDGLETTLAERIALLTWRLRRLGIYEREEIAISQENAEEDYFTAPETNTSQRIVDRILEYESPREPMSIARLRTLIKDAGSLLQVARQLPELPGAQPIDSEQAQAILISTLAIVESASDHPTDVDVDFLATWGEIEAWTAYLVRQAIEETAARAELTDDLPWIYEQLVERFQSSKAKHEQELTRAEQGIEQLRRKRMLPDESKLQTIVRYEAHLNRQFLQSMQALIALRSRWLEDAGTVAEVDMLPAAASATQLSE